MRARRGQTLEAVAERSRAEYRTPTVAAQAVAMGLANAVVRNYSSLALLVAGTSFGYGLFYAVTYNSSPLADAKASLGEWSHPHPLFTSCCPCP